MYIRFIHKLYRFFLDGGVFGFKKNYFILLRMSVKTNSGHIKSDLRSNRRPITPQIAIINENYALEP